MNKKHLDHKCGVFGIMHHPQSLHLTYLGVFALQHRGQEAAGIYGCYSDLAQDPFLMRGIGLVHDVFDKQVLAQTELNHAVGHVRYSTSGSKQSQSVHPLIHEKRFAFCHNGNIPKGDVTRSHGTDSEMLFTKILEGYDPAHPLASLKESLIGVEGAYCLIIMTPEGLCYARDPWGIRPLVLGYVEEAPVVCSETCALDLIGATFTREVEPGEVGFIPFKENRLEVDYLPKSSAMSQKCVFELIYFSRPDSTVFGHGVYETRKELGRLLAKSQPVEADLVMAVPDSGVPASLGYAETSGISWDVGLIRNHYIHRTFIEPTHGVRHLGVKIKHNPIRDVVAGKRLVLVDDSLVRSTTSLKIIKLLKQCGAKEVTLAVSSPPMMWPCFYGVDTPNRDELIAAQMSVEKIRERINADRLVYLPLEDLQEYFGEKYCYACFNGKYKVATEEVTSLLEE